jgi:hypothetical protein
VVIATITSPVSGIVAGDGTTAALDKIAAGVETIAGTVDETNDAIQTVTVTP